VSVWRVEIWKLTDVLLGSGVLAFALVRLHAGVGALQMACFVAALLSGCVVVYGFWLILATLAFWLVRVENILVIFQSVYEAARWPVGIYPPWLRLALTFLIPVAFATSVPASALAGKLSLQALGGAALFAAALFTAARLFWRVGLRQYSGASS
jgi:ABC-2 type transport system permease protein